MVFEVKGTDGLTYSGSSRDNDIFFRKYLDDKEG